MTTKFKAGDKVKRISGSFAGTYVGGEYIVAGYGEHGWRMFLEEKPGKGFDDRFFELIEPAVQVRSFDIHKDKWFIRTPTKEACEAAQEWLFEQGFGWKSYGKKVMFSDCTDIIMNVSKEPADTIWREVCFPEDTPENQIQELLDVGYYELELTFKTVVDTVEYPTIAQEALVIQEQSEVQKQVDILEQKIKELQDQLEVVKEEIK